MGPALPCVNAGIFLLTGANIGIKSGFLQRMWEKNVIFVRWLGKMLGEWSDVRGVI